MPWPSPLLSDCLPPRLVSNPLLQALHPETKQQQGKVETELGVSWEGAQSKGSEDSGPAEVASVAVKGNRRSTPGGQPRQGQMKVENIYISDIWGTILIPERHGLSFKLEIYKHLLD